MSRIVKAADVIYEDAPPEPSAPEAGKFSKRSGPPDLSASESDAPSEPSDFPEAPVPKADGFSEAGGSPEPNGRLSDTPGSGARGESVFPPLDAPTNPPAAETSEGARPVRGAIPELLDGARAMRLAKREAGELLRAARRECESLKEAARQEGEALKQTAQEEGLAEGKREAAAQVEAEFRDILQALRTAQEEAMARRDKLAAELGPEWVKLALAVAERLVCKEIERGAETALHVGEEILRGAAPGGRLTLHLNPIDYEQLERSETWGRLQQSGAGMQTVELLPDEGVGRGGCLLETDNGVVDGRLGERLAAVERALMEQAGEVSEADGDDPDRTT